MDISNIKNRDHTRGNLSITALVCVLNIGTLYLYSLVDGWWAVALSFVAMCTLAGGEWELLLITGQLLPKEQRKLLSSSSCAIKVIHRCCSYTTPLAF